MLGISSFPQKFHFPIEVEVVLNSLQTQKCLEVVFKEDFNPDIYVLHVGANDLTLSDTPEQIAGPIFDIYSQFFKDRQ